MKNALFVSLAVALVLGCGSSSKSAAEAKPPTTESKAPVSEGPCTATLTSERKPDWVETGTLTITLSADKPTGAILRDASRKPVMTDPMPSDGERATEWMLKSACAVGAVFLYLPKEQQTIKDGPVVVSLLRPAKEDEAGDLAMLCHEPAGVPADFDPTQKLMVAVVQYDESLTSSRWRGWLRGMDVEMKKASGPDARRAIKGKGADELDAAAKKQGLGSCWLATALRPK